MTEKPAKNTKGYILYSPFRKKDPYFFRVYHEEGNFTCLEARTPLLS